LFARVRGILPAWSTLFTLLISSLSPPLWADPVITQSRFELEAEVDAAELGQIYDSDDEARVVTYVDKSLSAYRDEDYYAGDCTVTDSARSSASIQGLVKPREIIVSGTAERIWTTSYHELCDEASIGFDASSSARVQFDAGDDAAAGISYDVNISGTVTGDVYGWLEGLDTGSSIDRRRSFSAGTFSRTYRVDMSGARAGQLEFIVVNSNPDFTGPFEREETYTAEDTFRLRVVLINDDDPTPPEVCDNGFDDDFDGDIDSDDSQCPKPEVCDNSIDDDLDGDIDAADSDCAPRVGLLARCRHNPVYPQAGETVTLSATAYDSNAEPIPVDELEIYLNDGTTPVATVANDQFLETTFTADNGTFSYGCRAYRNSAPFPETATSWGAGDPLLRTVDTGTREPLSPAWGNVVPIMLNGPPREKIDIIFFADDDEYEGATDPDFQAGVFDLIVNGYYRIPWFIKFQHYFNFWLAFDSDANASLRGGDNPKELCAREAPAGFESRYSWADSAAIVHSEYCRDNAGGPGLFTIWSSANQTPQVIAHETGHRPFGLADEYCCDGGYFGSKRGFLSSKWDPPYPNAFEKQKHCEEDADGRPYDPSDCRLMNTNPPDLDKPFWFPEAFYDLELPADYKLDQTFDPNTQHTRDLMQQTGLRCFWVEIKDAEGNPTGNFNWSCGAQYDVGISERDRMSWYLSKCLGGEC
jgi:hypothetical protein